MDRTSDFGSESCGFESCQGRYVADIVEHTFKAYNMLFSCVMELQYNRVTLSAGFARVGE